MSTQSSRFLTTILTCLSVASADSWGETSPKVDFFAAEGMSEHSSNLKAAYLILPPKARAKINRSRWSKGQYQLPEELCGYGFDVDADGVSETIIPTGDGDPSGRGSYLVIRGLPNRCEIVAAFTGSFSFIERKGKWADLVVFEVDSRYYLSRTIYRHDGPSYVRFKKEVQLHIDSPIQIIESDDDKPAAALPDSK